MNGTIQKGQQYMRRKTTDIPTIYNLKQNCPLRHFSRSLKYLFRLFVYNVTQDTYINKHDRIQSNTENDDGN